MTDPRKLSEHGVGPGSAPASGSALAELPAGRRQLARTPSSACGHDGWQADCETCVTEYLAALEAMGYR